jgi:hypothetical protein
MVGVEPGRVGGRMFGNLRRGLPFPEQQIALAVERQVVRRAALDDAKALSLELHLGGDAGLSSETV